MLGYVFGKRRWPIALDIGTDGIKMLQMHRVGGSVSVRAAGRWRFPPAAGEDPAKWRNSAEGVREILRKGDFHGNHVVSALSCRQLRIKNVRLPSMSPQELEESIRWEARERFGCDFAPDQLHYLPAGQVRQGNEMWDEIILIAAPGDVVESHLALLTEMGLCPEHIDAEPLAMFRPFERTLRRRSDEKSISVIVDIGHSTTKVIVAKGRRILLVKSVGVGGRNFTEAVARQLNLSHDDAAELRIQIMREHNARSAAGPIGEDAEQDPNSASWTVLDAVRGVVEDLAREIALCLRYCAVTFRGLRPDQVTVVGGQAYDAAAMRLLGEQLGAECYVGQPLRGVDTSGVDLGGDRRSVLAEWAVCTGLALRDAQWRESLRKGNHERHRLPA